MALPLCEPGELPLVAIVVMDVCGFYLVSRAQDVVNRVVLGIHRGVGMDCLDDVYNCMIFADFPRKCNINDPKMSGNALVHFAATQKPWKMNKDTCARCGYPDRCAYFCKWLDWYDNHLGVRAAIANIKVLP